MPVRGTKLECIDKLTSKSIGTQHEIIIDTISGKVGRGAPLPDHDNGQRISLLRRLFHKACKTQIS